MGLPPGRRKTPLIILGGSDHKPAVLPPQGHGLHPLSGCKGVDVRIGGRCLIDHLVERLRESSAFAPIFVAGPAAVYQPLGMPVELIDTDRGFGGNIQTALETVMRSCPGREVGFVTCDILPDRSELAMLLENYWHGPTTDVWFPLILTDEDQPLGTADWKPRYRVVPSPGEAPAVVLPGHLTILDPAALNLSMLYRLFDLAYRTRNRPIRYRRSYLLRHVLWTLVRQDLSQLLSLRLPWVTWDVVRGGLRSAAGLRRGNLPLATLEEDLRRVFVLRSHRRRHPERRVRMPLLRALSIARDIDTVEEAEALGATFA